MTKAYTMNKANMINTCETANKKILTVQNPHESIPS